MNGRIEYDFDVSSVRLSQLRAAPNDATSLEIATMASMASELKAIRRSRAMQPPTSSGAICSRCNHLIDEHSVHGCESEDGTGAVCSCLRRASVIGSNPTYGGGWAWLD